MRGLNWTMPKPSSGPFYGLCPACHGTGKESIPCGKCAGTKRCPLFERSVEDALRLLPSSLPPPAPRETPASASESPSPRETAPTPDAGASPSVPDSRVWTYAGLIILIAMGVGGLRLIRVTHR